MLIWCNVTFYRVSLIFSIAMPAGMDLLCVILHIVIVDGTA